MANPHPWERHRFLHEVRQALVAGHNQCFLHGRNVEQEWFHNGPLLGVQDMCETLAYNLLYVEGELAERVLVLAKSGMTLYSRPPEDSGALLPDRAFPRHANELEALLRGEPVQDGPGGVLAGDGGDESATGAGNEQPAGGAASAPVPLDEAAIPEVFHRITHLMAELQRPFSVIVNGFQWLAELFPGRQHRLELVEEINRWASVALGGGKLSMILLPDLETLKTYLTLREEDNHVIYVAGPSVSEIASALGDFAGKMPGRFERLPELDEEAFQAVASALKNKGYSLLNAVHHFDRFTIEALKNPPADREALLTAFKEDLGVDLDDVRWEDVQLPAETRQAIENLMQRFLDPDDDNPPKGVLLHGPPGTGKTHIARALANRGGFYFQPLKLADLKGRYVGESGRNVQAIFAEARASAPTLMFIDEIDAVLGRRGGREQDSFSNDIVNQFLAETDGVNSSRQKIFIVATTNRPDLVDPAVKSRLPTLEIGLPDAAARRAMLEQGIGRVVPLDDATLERLVARTEGLSGRDLRKTLQEQVLRAHRAGADDPVAAGMEAMRRIIVEQLNSGAAHIRLARQDAPGLERLIGHQACKAQLRAVADELLRPPERLAQLGIPPRNGILLYGPPGNGKTALVEALADEYGLDLMVISGSQLRAAGSLDSVRGLDELVQDAMRIAVTGEGILLFFDEFDALAQAPLNPQFRSALLGNIDRVRRQGQTLLAAATNKYDDLEEAVVRAGRFDLHLPLPPPAANEIERLIRQWVGEGPFTADFDDTELAELATAWARRRVSVSDVKVAVDNARRQAVMATPDARQIAIPIDYLRLGDPVG